VTPLDLQDWKSYLLHEATFRRTSTSRPQRYSINSVNNNIKGIKSFFDYYKAIGRITSNPADKLKPQKVQADYDEDPRWLERIEKNRLLLCVNDERMKKKNPWRFARNRAIVYCGLHAGLRVSEIVALELEDLDFNKSYVYISDGKGGKARRVEMNMDLRNSLLEWLAERGEHQDPPKVFLSQKGMKGITENAVERMLRNMGEKIGIKDLTPHVLRHTFAHDLVERGVSIRLVADLLGHASIDTTRKYIRSNKRERRSAVDQLSGERD
jgi:site-specific recombinase XerD